MRQKASFWKYKTQCHQLGNKRRYQPSTIFDNLKHNTQLIYYYDYSYQHRYIHTRSNLRSPNLSSFKRQEHHHTEHHWTSKIVNDDSHRQCYQHKPVHTVRHDIRCSSTLNGHCGFIIFRGLMGNRINEPLVRNIMCFSCWSMFSSAIVVDVASHIVYFSYM
jgi:hypothetical protein